MDDIYLDKQKALDLAKELGLEVSFGSDKPGVYISNNGTEEFYRFQNFFSELFNFDLDFHITKETYNLESLSKKIEKPIRREIKNINIKIETKFQKYGLYDAA